MIYSALRKLRRNEKLREMNDFGNFTIKGEEFGVLENLLRPGDAGS
jgi:hypothetical protein